MKREPSRAALITGCSSGIGRATAARLARRGYRVYATARNLESVEDLRRAGCDLLRLDVTDEDSMRSALAAVEEAEDGIDILVNNAGYGLHGAVETTPLEDVRAQFETNFFGLVALTKLVAPGMRRRGWGKIVNVSSMGGKLTFPGGAFYHASKHALEAFSDALRFELSGFGIDVIVIEPGLIKTAFGDRAIATIEHPQAEEEPYALFNQEVMLKINGAYNGRLARTAAPPDAVARVIEKAISARRPRTRYPVTTAARLLMTTRRLLPDRVFDALLRRQYPSPRS